MQNRRPRRTYTEEFKVQMVSLYNAGKPMAEINREYELTPSSLRRWIDRINKSGSTKEADNRSPLEEEVLKLQAENKQLKMERDLLKQAALILGQK